MVVFAEVGPLMETYLFCILHVLAVTVPSPLRQKADFQRGFWSVRGAAHSDAPTENYQANLQLPSTSEFQIEFQLSVGQLLCIVLCPLQVSQYQIWLHDYLRCFRPALLVDTVLW